jgi:S-adenosylhomocysteine hydrolase
MQVKHFLILLLCACVCAGNVYGQSHALQGIVLDAKNSVLPGASVVVMGNADSVKGGTTTNT